MDGITDCSVLRAPLRIQSTSILVTVAELIQPMNRGPSVIYQHVENGLSLDDDTT